MKLYLPDSPLVTLHLVGHGGELFKVIGQYSLTDLPRRGDAIQFTMADDEEIYLGYVKLVKWYFTDHDGDNTPLVEIHCIDNEEAQ